MGSPLVMPWHTGFVTPAGHAIKALEHIGGPQEPSPGWNITGRLMVSTLVRRSRRPREQYPEYRFVYPGPTQPPWSAGSAFQGACRHCSRGGAQEEAFLLSAQVVARMVVRRTVVLRTACCHYLGWWWPGWLCACRCFPRVNHNGSFWTTSQAQPSSGLRSSERGARCLWRAKRAAY